MEAIELTVQIKADTSQFEASLDRLIQKIDLLNEKLQAAPFQSGISREDMQNLMPSMCEATKNAVAAGI